MSTTRITARLSTTQFVALSHVLCGPAFPTWEAGANLVYVQTCRHGYRAAQISGGQEQVHHIDFTNGEETGYGIQHGPLAEYDLQVSFISRKGVGADPDFEGGPEGYEGYYGFDPSDILRLWYVSSSQLGQLDVASDDEGQFTTTYIGNGVDRESRYLGLLLDVVDVSSLRVHCASGHARELLGEQGWMGDGDYRRLSSGLSAKQLKEYDLV